MLLNYVQSLIFIFIFTINGLAILAKPLSIESNKFHCADGKKIIEKSQVNDNYCDCADNSDEPLTSACNKGEFKCKTDIYPKYIPISHVDDGICDCCDGSDEISTGVDCEITCPSLKKEERVDIDEKNESEENYENITKNNNDNVMNKHRNKDDIGSNEATKNKNIQIDLKKKLPEIERFNKIKIALQSPFISKHKNLSTMGVEKTAITNATQNINISIGTNKNTELRITNNKNESLLHFNSKTNSLSKFDINSQTKIQNLSNSTSAHKEDTGTPYITEKNAISSFNSTSAHKGDTVIPYITEKNEIGSSNFTSAHEGNTVTPITEKNEISSSNSTSAHEGNTVTPYITEKNAISSSNSTSAHEGNTVTPYITEKNAISSSNSTSAYKADTVIPYITEENANNSSNQLKNFFSGNNQLNNTKTEFKNKTPDIDSVTNLSTNPKSDLDLNTKTTIEVESSINSPVKKINHDSSLKKINHITKKINHDQQSNSSIIQKLQNNTKTICHRNTNITDSNTKNTTDSNTVPIRQSDLYQLPKIEVPSANTVIKPKSNEELNDKLHANISSLSDDPALNNLTINSTILKFDPNIKLDKPPVKPNKKRIVNPSKKTVNDNFQIVKPETDGSFTLYGIEFPNASQNRTTIKENSIFDRDEKIYGDYGQFRYLLNKEFHFTDPNQTHIKYIFRPYKDIVQINEKESLEYNCGKFLKWIKNPPFTHMAFVGGDKYGAKEFKKLQRQSVVSFMCDKKMEKISNVLEYKDHLYWIIFRTPSVCGPSATMETIEHNSKPELIYFGIFLLVCVLYTAYYIIENRKKNN